MTNNYRDTAFELPGRDTAFELPQRETAFELMLDVVPDLRRLVDEVAKHDKDLARQIRRAAESVVSNHGEADGVQGGHRRERVGTALGSANELLRQVQWAAAWGYTEPARANRIITQVRRVCAMSYRRLHPRR